MSPVRRAAFNWRKPKNETPRITAKASRAVNNAARSVKVATGIPAAISNQTNPPVPSFVATITRGASSFITATGGMWLYTHARRLLSLSWRWDQGSFIVPMARDGAGACIEAGTGTAASVGMPAGTTDRSAAEPITRLPKIGTPKQQTNPPRPFGRGVFLSSALKSKSYRWNARAGHRPSSAPPYPARGAPSAY